MSDIGLDLSVLYYAIAIALAGPVVARWLANRQPAFWRRLLTATLGGPLLATLAGAIADAIKPDDEIAFLALILAACVQLPISLALFLFARRSP